VFAGLRDGDFQDPELSEASLGADVPVIGTGESRCSRLRSLAGALAWCRSTPVFEVMPTTGDLYGLGDRVVSCDRPWAASRAGLCSGLRGDQAAQARMLGDFTCLCAALVERARRA